MVIVIFLGGDLQRCFEGITRCPQQLTGEGRGLFATHFVAGNGVVVLTAILIEASAHVEVQRVLDNRATDVGIGIGGVVLGNGDSDLTFHLVSGSPGHIVDRARERGTTIESRLRAFDDLNALEHLQLCRGDRARHENTVNKEGRVGGAQDIRHAPDHRAVGIPSKRIHEGETRCERRNILRRKHAVILKRGSIKGSDRKRHFLQVFLALSRGDHDLF